MISSLIIKKHSWPIKVVTHLVCLSFLLPVVSWSFDSSALMTGQGTVMFNNRLVHIPSRLATVQSFHQGTGPVVIQLQDLHCNYEVQMNIAKLIARLSQEQQLKLVAVEGSSQPINPTEIRSFPLEKIRKEVSDYFVKQGKLTGAEYCAATGKNPIRLEGIEDARLYAENKKSVDMLLSHEALGYCYDLRDALNNLKPTIYSKRLHQVDAQFEKFRLGRVPLSAYAVFLSRLARKLKLSLKAFPNFEAYRGHGAHDQKADPEALFGEMDRLEQLIREKYYSRPEERFLDEQLGRLTLIEKLLNISATPEEVALFRTGHDLFNVQTFMDFINRHQGKEASTQTQILSPDLYRLDDYLKEAKTFYQGAEARSRAFVDNTIAAMQEQKQGIALLITGGYHTDGVLKALKEKGLSYLALKPRLTKQDVLNPYFSLLTSKPTALEQWLSQEQRKFALQSYLPKSQDPTKIPDESGLTVRERSFKRLLVLLFKVRTIAYAHMQNKVIYHLNAVVKKLLAGYAGQARDIQIGWSNIKVYKDHTMTVPIRLGAKAALAVIGPKAVSGLVKQEERLDVAMTIGSHPIVLVAPEYIEAVTQRLAAWRGHALDTSPLVRLIAVYLVLTFLLHRGRDLNRWLSGLPWRGWGNTIKGWLLKVFWAPWRFWEAMVNTLKNGLYQEQPLAIPAGMDFEVADDPMSPVMMMTGTKGSQQSKDAKAHQARKELIKTAILAFLQADLGEGLGEYAGRFIEGVKQSEPAMINPFSGRIHYFENYLNYYERMEKHLRAHLISYKNENWLILRVPSKLTRFTYNLLHSMANMTPISEIPPKVFEQWKKTNIGPMSKIQLHRQDYVMARVVNYRTIKDSELPDHCPAEKVELYGINMAEAFNNIFIAQIFMKMNQPYLWRYFFVDGWPLLFNFGSLLNDYRYPNTTFGVLDFTLDFLNTKLFLSPMRSDLITPEVEESLTKIMELQRLAKMRHGRHPRQAMELMTEAVKQFSTLLKNTGYGQGLLKAEYLDKMELDKQLDPFEAIRDQEIEVSALEAGYQEIWITHLKHSLSDRQKILKPSLMIMLDVLKGEGQFEQYLKNIPEASSSGQPPLFPLAKCLGCRGRRRASGRRTSILLNQPPMARGTARPWLGWYEHLGGGGAGWPADGSPWSAALGTSA